MKLPPLYKYLDVEGAKLTLRNRNFRHAKPSSFNDLEELTIRSIFPESEEVALTEMKNSFVDILVENINAPPKCANPQMRAKIALMQEAVRRNPDAATLVRNATKEAAISSFFDLDHMREMNRQFVKEVNDFMQGHRILCVSKLNDSEEMWVRYAQDHQGVVLRILPNTKKDSKFSLFREVTYNEARPPLYESVRSFLKGSLFEDREVRLRALLDNIIYTKTLNWKYEQEYRLAIPIFDGEDWNMLPYHPEEISELYLGLKTTEETSSEIASLALAMNPEISMFRAFLDPNKKISFREYDFEDT
jgi:hypothetical protein